MLSLILVIIGIAMCIPFFTVKVPLYNKDEAWFYLIILIIGVIVVISGVITCIAS